MSTAPYLPVELPSPEPVESDEGFWASCNERRLAFQQCGRCAVVVHPPVPACPSCGSLDRGWVEAPAQARVFTFTWVHTAAHASVKASLPYAAVLVEFPELPQVLLVSNVVDAKPQTLRIGDALSLVWEQGWNGQWLPRFRRIEDATTPNTSRRAG
jgi:hypothetical protein